MARDRWYKGHLISGPNVYGMYSVLFEVSGGGQQFAADTLAGMKAIIRDYENGLIK